MPTPDEYRKIAETYYHLAREAKTEADRLALLDLAKNWLEAASREEAKSVRERRGSWRARAPCWQRSLSFAVMLQGLCAKGSEAGARAAHLTGRGGR